MTLDPCSANPRRCTVLGFLPPLLLSLPTAPPGNHCRIVCWRLLPLLRHFYIEGIFKLFVLRCAHDQLTSKTPPLTIVVLILDPPLSSCHHQHYTSKLKLKCSACVSASYSASFHQTTWNSRLFPPGFISPSFCSTSALHPSHFSEFCHS